MPIYRIHPDRLNYQMLTISTKEVVKQLGEENLYHIDPTVKPYSPVWKPLDVEFYNSVQQNKTMTLPDITVNNHKMFLNQKAFNILHDILKQHGEFLPVTFNKDKVYLFNAFSLAEDVDAIDRKLSLKNEYDELISLGFHQDKLDKTTIFRTAFDNFMSFFCLESFVQLVTQSGLKGICFSENISNMFPPDPSAQQPAKH